MQKIIHWSVRIILAAILLFITLFAVASSIESISEMDFIEIMKRPPENLLMGLFLIFALVSYVTSWFNTKLTAKLLLIFGLVLAVFTFIAPSVSVKTKAFMTPFIGIFILAPIVYWALKRKK